MNIAFVLINCEFGSEEEIILKLRTISGVQDVCRTFGAYDFVATIKSDSEEDLRNIISGNIRIIPKIRSTLTLTVNTQE